MQRATWWKQQGHRVGQTENKSKLVSALEKRKRAIHTFEVNSFFGLGKRPIHKVGIRVNTKSEQDSAVIAAHHYLENEALTETAKNDDDLVLDAKAISVLHKAIRQHDDPTYPAFPDDKWMRENLTTDQIAVLLNLYNQCAQKESPLDHEIDRDKANAYAMALGSAAGSPVADEMLSYFSREYLTQLCIYLSQELFELRGDDEDTPDDVES